MQNDSLDKRSKQWDPHQEEAEGREADGEAAEVRATTKHNRVRYPHCLRGVQGEEDLGGLTGEE